MDNKPIAKAFQFLGELMELHEENPFKVRSYQNAYMTLRKWEQPLGEMPLEEIEAIKGVGKAIAGKIKELLDSGQMQTLEKYKAQTPEGVQEMLQIKGFGPKKVRTVWKDLGVETIGELLYAINENRLLELKGFGKKTQEDLRQQLEYYRLSKDKFLYATAENEALALVKALQTALPPSVKVEWTGAIRRRELVLESIEVLVGTADLSPSELGAFLTEIQPAAGGWRGVSPSGFPVRLHVCQPDEFGSKQFRHSAAPSFLEAFLSRFPGQDFKGLAEETAVFERAGLPYLAPELRSAPDALSRAIPELLDEEDIRGVVHAHSTYSDGLHALQEMAESARNAGFAYLVITDHSKSAFYANGLSIERVLAQMAEIEALNAAMAPFRIFKGIESDILADGSLDYPEEILAQFEVVIASVHSNLKMDEAKATARIIRAIENPHTRILGHPTGRLLLSRPGYPLDHRAVIDACAANGVAIELNANPYRLDLDWAWIPYAIEKQVWISINPDAHSREGIRDIHFGVLAARKGGLEKSRCLNAMDLESFAEWVGKA
ncbi:MAG: DNA polymerase/3'-5' exonuclease PolX [Haliscomenobacter sp.]|nr:DNA polymerase/3'-5' exonuclease PolX [Haliscomenobacter sp.]